MTTTSINREDILVQEGGSPLRTEPFPNRGHFGEEEWEAVSEVFKEAMATGNAPGYGGAYEKAYEAEFAEYLGGGFAKAISSGTNSLYVTLRALDLDPCAEIIVSCVTDPGGMMPIPLAFHIPIVADTAPGRFNASADQIRACITDRTRAIVLPYIAGEPCDAAAIRDLAEEHGLFLIEDCSQSHGAKWQGQYLGTFGHAAIFSTMYGKHHCTGGQGGMVFTRDVELFNRVRRAADRGKPHGIDAPDNVEAHLNSNASDLNCAIGSAQLKKLPGLVARRRVVAKQIIAQTAHLPWIYFQDEPEGGESSFWWLTFNGGSESIGKTHSDVVRALEAEGLPIGERYNAMPHTYEWFKEKRVFGGSKLPWSSEWYKGDPDQEFDCPNAMAMRERSSMLLFNEGWSDEDVCDAMAIIYKIDRAWQR